MPASRSRSSHAYHHGDLRNACVQAALGLLATHGLNGVTLREVAARIGVSRSAPYRHFADKRALLAACAAAGFDALTANARAVRAAHPVPDLAALRATLRGYAVFGASDPNLYRLMFAGDFRHDEYPDLARAAQQGFTVFEDLVRDGQAAGRIAAGATYARVLTLWAAVHGLVTLCNDLAPSPMLDTGALDAHLERVFDTLAPAFVPD